MKVGYLCARQEAHATRSMLDLRRPPLRDVKNSNEYNCEEEMDSLPQVSVALPPRAPTATIEYTPGLVQLTMGTTSVMCWCRCWRWFRWERLDASMGHMWVASWVASCNSNLCSTTPVGTQEVVTAILNTCSTAPSCPSPKKKKKKK